MAAFQYVALDSRGKKRKGVTEADTARQVREELRQKGLMPLEVHLVSEKSQKEITVKGTKKKFRRGKKIKPAQLALITRQMATLLAAGIPIDEMLSGVAEQTMQPYIKSIILGVRGRVLEGHSLATGMGEFPKAFSKLYRTTVASGEKSGQLHQVLEKLASYTERQHYIRTKIRQALIYPVMMTIVSATIVIFLLIYVVPKIVGALVQAKQTLPMATRILLAASHFIQVYGVYILIALIIGFFIFRRLMKRQKFRRYFDRILLRIPIIGRTIRIINSARFGRTFGILTSATVPVLEGMHASAQLVGPLPMREGIETAVARVREGTSIHYALQQTKYFEPMFIHLIASGETSGQLSPMLEKAANNQENEVEALIDGTLALFEPMMIIVMGGIVLFIVLAVMLPVFSLDQLNV